MCKGVGERLLVPLLLLLVMMINDDDDGGAAGGGVMDDVDTDYRVWWFYEKLYAHCACLKNPRPGKMVFLLVDRSTHGTPGIADRDKT